MGYILKVVFKDKTINLGSKVTSLDQIKQLTQLRLNIKKNTNLVYKFSDQIINSFSQIEEIVQNQNLTSIKIILEQILIDQSLSQKTEKVDEDNEFKMFEDSDLSIIDKSHSQQNQMIESLSGTQFEEMLIEEHSINDSEYTIVHEKHQKGKSVSFESLIESSKQDNIGSKNKQQYQCFYCLDLETCPICHKTGYIPQDSPVHHRLNQMFATRLQAYLKDYTIIPKQKTVQKGYQQKQLKIEAQKAHQLLAPISAELESKIKVSSQQSNIKSVLEGIEFLWEFKVDIPPELSKYQIFIMDQKTGLNKVIRKSDIMVGPFVALDQKTFSRNFTLFYYEQNSTIKLLGKKFGFDVAVVSLEKKNGSSKQKAFEKKVKQMMKTHNISRSLAEIIEKLTYIGINEDNYRQSHQIIQELLTNL